MVYWGLAVVLAALPALRAEAPAWWAERGVLKSGSAAADDYAVINQGQLRHIAKQAYNEMDARLLGGAGPALDAIWFMPVRSADDYRTVNLGQLKNLAKPFYTRLIAAGLASSYPWSGTGADDYALANIGQVKHLFAFTVNLGLPADGDADTDGIPNEWEIGNQLNPLVDDATGDGDADGLTNLEEFQTGTSLWRTDANELGLVIYTP